VLKNLLIYLFFKITSLLSHLLSYLVLILFYLSCYFIFLPSLIVFFLIYYFLLFIIAFHQLPIKLFMKKRRNSGIK